MSEHEYVDPAADIYRKLRDKQVNPHKYDGSRFAYLTENQVLSQPDPRYLIQGLVPEGAVGLLVGSWGTYKTFSALDMALSLTHGLPDYHGHDTTNGHGAVCYIAGEGAGGIGKRVRAWRTYHKVATSNSPFYLIRVNVAMAEKDDNVEIDRLVNTLKSIEKDNGCQFKLIVVDTVSRSIKGALENEETFGRLLSNTEYLKEKIGNGCSVLLVHHLGKDGTRGARGSSVIEANADYIIEVSADQKVDRPDEVKMIVKKLKDDEDGQKFDYVTCQVTSARPSGPDQGSMVLIKQSDETPGQKLLREQARKHRITPQNPSPSFDKKAERIKNWLRLIAEVAAGHYTRNQLLVAVSKGASQGNYDNIADALPLNDTKTLLDSQHKTKTITRVLDPNESIIIT